MDDIRQGSRRALAKGLTLLEDRDTSFIQLVLSQTYTDPFKIGFTGPPGAGKSSLIEAILPSIAKTKKVGVLATDPSSPFSGGALLGDRVRLNANLSDKVTYRSLATRGSRGSLATVTRLATRLMALSGCDWVIYETVGAGQNELDVQALADCIVLVVVPESGDSLQAMKAGILELADLIVVNKSDRPGSESILEELKTTTSTRKQFRDPAWTPLIFPTIANESKGIETLYDSLNDREQHCKSNTHLKKFQQQREIEDLVLDNALRQLGNLSQEQWDQLIKKLNNNSLDFSSLIKLNAE